MHIRTPGPEPDGYIDDAAFQGAAEPIAWPPDGRVVITGVPGAGKTLLSAEAAEAMGVEPVNLDELALYGLHWDEVQRRAVEQLDAPGPILVEGHHAARALRAWLADNPIGAPCGLLVYMPFAPANASPSQRRVGAGVITVMAQIGDELIKRGVKVVVR